MLNGALLLTGVLLLAYGAEPLYHAAMNREQVTLTCDAFAQSPPRALWLRVTGCEIDYLGAGFRESNGRIVELYFPVRPVQWPREAPAPLVASTRDPEILALAEATMGGGRTPSQEQFLVMMLKIVTALRAAREIEGYREDNVVDRLKTRADLSSLSTPLAPDAPVVELHARPGFLRPGATAAAGLLLLGMAAVLRAKRRGAMAITRSPGDALTTTPAGTPVRVLLLNLPPDAGRESIEHAPPLGTRDEVEKALTSALGGMQFDASGRAAIDLPGVRVTLDIGPTDHVHAALVHVHGDAWPILRRIAERTGWRAFDAKSGAFVAAVEASRTDVRPLDHTAA